MMAVAHQENDNLILDSLEFYINCYGESLRPKACLYDVQSQYKMNTEHEAEARASHASLSADENGKRRRKRKRKKELSVEEDAVDGRVQSMFHSVMLSARAAGLFAYVSSPAANNIAAKSLVQSLGCGDLLIQLTSLSGLGGGETVNYIKFDNQQDASTCKESLFHNVIQSNCNDCLTLRIQGKGFVMPPRSKFLMSGIPGLQTFADTFQEKFDFIIVDPPWNNKSVRRKRVYEWLDNVDLLTLPVKSLSADTTLLALWSTNSVSQHNFIEHQLLPSWHYKVVSIWHWCKVTRSGEPILPFGTNGKKPYECLYIATRTNQQTPEMLTAARVLVSVPSLIHSSKPCILDVFKQHLPENARCLELFARNLLSDVFSWGNEVLFQQDTRFFGADA